MYSKDITITDEESKLKKRMLEFLEGNEYIQHLNIEILELRPGFGIGRMPYKKDVLNPYGSVHGGVLYSFADIVSGTVAAMDGLFATTLNGSLNYLLPADKTSYLYCKAESIRDGKNIAVYRIVITDDDGNVVDDGSFTFYKTKIKVLDN